MGDSKESEALLKYHDKLVAFIKNNLDDIAKFLRQKRIINKTQYDTFTNSLIREDHVRAKMTFTAIDNKIEEDEEVFVTFVKYLYSKELYHKHGLALIREYEKLGGSVNTTDWKKDDLVTDLTGQKKGDSVDTTGQKKGDLVDTTDHKKDNSVLPDQPGSYFDLSSQAFDIQSDCQIVKSDMTDEQKVKFAVEQMDLNQPDLKDINGKGTTIAVIDLIGTMGDKGFHCKHKAFDGAITEADVQCFKKQQFKDVTNHATTCTGIAVGKPFNGKYLQKGKYIEQKYEGGVAPGAKASIFLIERDLDCFLSALKAVKSGNFDVVSISLNKKLKNEGEGLLEKNRKQLDDIREAIINLGDSTHVVISAGNYGPVKGVLFPANIEEKVISVGGFDEFGAKLNYVPNCVSIDGYCEVCAPATPDSGAATGLLKWARGTSMAAPAIAGVICLFIQCAREGRYPNGEADKKDVLQRMMKKDNMIRILKKTINDEQQVKPAEILRAIKKVPDFKIWFDEMTSNN